VFTLSYGSAEAFVSEVTVTKVVTVCLGIHGTNGGPDEGWLPRVRKVARDGKVTTLVTITAEANAAAERF